MRRRLSICCVAFGALLLTGADWRQFRGSQANSVAEADLLPLEWGQDKNVAWRVDLPGRGPSSPIVVRGRVIVTCSSGPQQGRLHVLCFDANSGDQLWERQFWATGRTLTHPSSANAAPTPASDGERLFAFYSSNDLVCLDLDGNLCWYRGLAYDYPKAGNDVGMASSPAVAEGTVVVQIENHGDSFAAGLDTTTGETRWRLQRPLESNWSSPVITRGLSDRPLVLLKSNEGLDAHDLHTGEHVWRYDTPADGIPSLVTHENHIFLPGDGLSCLKWNADGGPPELAWASSRLNPGPASPIIWDGQIYVLNRAGVLTCGDAQQGNVLWQLRLKGSFWATPVLVNGHLYCVNDAGVAQVVRLAPRGELVGESEFGETIQGSPAVGENGMFVRSDRWLWKISAE